MSNAAHSNTPLALLPADSSRRVYSGEFRSEAVKRVNDGQPISQVAHDLGIARNTLKAWIKEAQQDAVVPLVAVMESDLKGNRIQVLEALRDSVATLIGNGLSGRDMPANARLLMDITKELQDLQAIEEAEEITQVEDEPWDPGWLYPEHEAAAIREAGGTADTPFDPSMI